MLSCPVLLQHILVFIMSVYYRGLKKQMLIPHNSPFIPEIPKTVLENGKVLFTIWRQKAKF